MPFPPNAQGRRMDMRMEMRLDTDTRRLARIPYLLGLACLALAATAAPRSEAQTINQAVAHPAAPLNALPNPYRSIESWARMPEGRTWGSSAGVYVDPAGTGVWVAERCRANSR